MDENNVNKLVIHVGNGESTIRIRSSLSQASVLRAMHDDDSLCDVNLYGISSQLMPVSLLQPIRAHKCVLAYASKYFRNLLTANGFIDPNLSVCYVENIDHETLRRIIGFVYTEQLTINVGNGVDVTCGILVGANHLAIKHLADICESFLAGDAQIKPENCIMLWCFARKHSCTKLMQAVSIFIAKNLSLMPKNVEFLRMPFDDCAVLLRSEAVSPADADQRCLSAIAWLNNDSIDRAAFVKQIVDMVPLNSESVSTDTITEAYECQMLHAHAPETVRKLMAGLLKKMKSEQQRQLPAESMDVVGELSSNNDSSWYVMGGVFDPKMFCKYDLNQRLWTNLPDLPWQREFFGATAADNNRHTVVMGGKKGGNYTSDIDEYDVVTQSWSTSSAKLASTRFGLATCCCDDDVYALGGSDAKPIEAYSCTSKKVSKLAGRGLLRSFFAAVPAANNNCIYVAGGVENHSGLIEKYDVSKNKWFKVGEMIYADRSGLAATISGDDLYFIGGRVDDVKLDTVELFNARTGQSCMAPQNLLQARVGCSATTLSNDGNVVCVLGGVGDDGKLLKGVETMDVREGKWTTGVIVSDMPKPACYFGFATV